jgi:putative flavoprotein involved in K+ transport
MQDRVETLIIGGGQAGLAMSHMLRQRGRRHIVLERHRIAERWRSERWNSLKFQFPNWSVRLPDFPLRCTDCDGFATSADIVDFISAYADFVAAPVRCGVAVTALRRHDSSYGFVAETSGGSIKARNVVVATGPYQRSVIPALSKDIDLFQVHASEYKDPDQLPAGAVLVVGSGASGAQVSEELIRAGRRVYLSVGRHRRMPRRYRGRDLTWWLNELGMTDMPVERRGPSKALPLITGAYGGHTIDFREFAAQGIILLGHVEAVRNGTIAIAPDLADSVEEGDATYKAFLDLVDAHVERHGMNMPSDPAARRMHSNPPCLSDPIGKIEFRASGINAVVWATGYEVDFSWVDIPVFDRRGGLIHRGGITELPGLYFLGLQWLSKMNSSFLSGVGDDAARLADHIAARTASREITTETIGSALFTTAVRA